MKKFLYSIFILMVFLINCGCENVINPSYMHEDENGIMIKKLVFTGSTSMSKVCDALGETFTQKNTDVLVEKSDTGSGAAIKSIVSGTADIGNLSRNLIKEEISENIQAVQIATDGIAIIVNKNNQIGGLNLENAGKIFTKNVVNWIEFGGSDSRITVIGREEASGTREGFEKALKIEGKSRYDAEYSESGDIISKVANDINAIGYVSLFSVSGNVRALKIDGVEPTAQNIISKRYKIQRPFIQTFIRNTENNVVFEWFNFLKTDEAKKVIESQGLVPAEINFDDSNIK